MRTARSRSYRGFAIVFLLVPALLALSVTPSAAQNKKRTWEIFIYFGEYGGQDVPSAIQQAVVRTYRLDPERAAFVDPNSQNALDPRLCPICENAGATGDPNGSGQQFLGPPLSTDPSRTPTQVDVCHDSNGNPLPITRDPSNPFYDECDDDIEAIYRYNPKGIKTNGQVQNSSNEFLLGARLGYNVTNHWEAELDIGFGKQRLDMTRNLIPMLSEPVSNPADPFFNQLANFYVFTWANFDFVDIGYLPSFDQSDPNILISVGGIHEIPNVPQHRASKNPSADIPAVLPMPLVAAETFADVTAFVNRIFLDPAAIRNRANKINIDVFSTGLSGLYNFNTKPDSRIVPYAMGGAGVWQRQFDVPYKGENSNYLSYGGGVRFFVNEIFSFRADFRQVHWLKDHTTITADIPRQNLIDLSVQPSGACMRDQDPPAQQPPQECSATVISDFNSGKLPRLPKGANPGGFASLKFTTALDDFWEARVGFDILLGGR